MIRECQNCVYWNRSFDQGCLECFKSIDRPMYKEGPPLPAAAFINASEKGCYNCRYLVVPSDQEPCRMCSGGACWTPESNAPTDDTAKADQGEPHMSYDERKAAYRDAIDRWGSYGQIWMAVEEMSELTNALCKLRRERCSVHDVAEEIADVTIMMEQLRMIFDVNEEVSGIMDKKIRRLNRRITLGKEGEHG